MNSAANPDSGRSSACLLVFALGVGVVLFYAWQQDYVAAVLAGTVTLAATSGYLAGAAKMLAVLISGGLAVVYAPNWSHFLTESFDMHPLNTPTMTTVAIGLGTVILGIVIGHLLTALIDSGPLQPVNRWCGLGIGAAQGAAAAVLLIGGVLAIAPSVSDGLASGGRSAAAWRVRAAETVVTVAKATEQSAVGPWIKRNNPFERFAPLRKAIESAQQG